jgi:hypothetical protein
VVGQGQQRHYHWQGPRSRNSAASADAHGASFAAHLSAPNPDRGQFPKVETRGTEDPSMLNFVHLTCRASQGSHTSPVRIPLLYRDRPRSDRHLIFPL